MAERAMYTREELINQIKACGQSIIDNADTILGDERYFLKVTVAFDIYRSRHTEPVINIDRMFTPEQLIEDRPTYEDLKLKNKDNIWR